MRWWLPVAAAGVGAALLVAVAMVLVFDARDADDGQEDAERGQESEQSGEVRELDDEQAPAPVDEQDSLGASGASFQVTTAWIDDGDCLFEVTTNNETCHRLMVLVNAGDEDFDVLIPFWQAQDEDGGLQRASWVVSPDRVPAGSSRSVTVAFDLQSDTRLVELTHESFDGPRLTVDVDTY